MVRILLAALVLLGAPALAHARERAPGAPGGKATWAPADKQGFGTSATKGSRVWFTLRKAELSELYYPDLSHPSTMNSSERADGWLSEAVMRPLAEAVEPSHRTR